MNANLLDTIKEKMQKMSKGQKSIAQYILDNYDKASFMTASKLGEVTDVSESTVVRFASSLGFDGYPKFQHALRELVRAKLTTVQRMEVSDDLLKGDVIDYVLSSEISKIRATIESVNRQDFSQAVEHILNAEHIYIIGMRSSAFLASFLAYNFRYMFSNATLIQTTSGSEIFEQLIHVTEKDVVIAISFPRYSKRIINAVDFAKAQNAYIVALTDGDYSPISTQADSKLYAKADISSFSDSIVSPLTVIDALIAAISSKKKSELQDTFSRLETIWDEYDIYDKGNRK